MEDVFYASPMQVLYRCKKDAHRYAGIAYGKEVISAKSGIVIPLEDIDEIKDVWWLDLTDTIKGDLTEVE